MPRTTQSGPASRTILIVSHLAPPSPMSAARRIAGLVKYLGRAGHRVIVVTSLVSGSGTIDGAARVVRTRDLMVSPLNWRRASFQSLEGGGDGTYDPTPSALAAVFVPDLEVVGWIPFALPAALRAARRHSVDCVITSGPPRSVHLIGLALRRRGVPWVADFRDGWHFAGRPAYPTTAQRRLDGHLERVVAQRANAIVGVTRPLAQDIADRFGVEATTITNGFDPEEEAPATPTSELPLNPDRVSIVHTGSFAYGDRSPQPLLDGLRVLRRRDADLAGRIELVFAGPLSVAERAAIESPDLEGAARAIGNLPRADALALQRGADALAVVTGPSQPTVATGKLYEYLAAAKPILVIGDESEAARIVLEAGVGFAAPVDRPDTIADALETLATSKAVPARGDIERYSYRAIAAQMADVVEGALAPAI